MRLASLTKVILSSVVILSITTTNVVMSDSDKHERLAQNVTAAMDDSTILAIFDQFNAYDIELAKIALEKGEQKSIRSLANMIVSDHPKLQKQGQNLATKLGISYTMATDNHFAHEHQRQVVELTSKNGTDFDDAYLQHELQFSETFVHAVKQQFIPAAQHAELKQFLKETLSQLEHHISHMHHAAGHMSKNRKEHGHH